MEQHNRPKQSRAPLLACGAVVIAVLAGALGYFWGHRTPAGSYTIDGDRGLFSFSTATAAHTTVAPTSTNTVAPAGELIDLNTATVEQLDTLPGIGPVLAQRIVEFRTAYGSFGSVDDLLSVSGIGQKLLDDIRHLVAVK